MKHSVVSDAPLDPPPSRRFRRNHAIVIGVDAYEGGVPVLRNAVRDALVIGRALGADHGFTVDALFDGHATADSVRALLAALRTRVTADDRVFVFVACHGVSLPSDDGLPAGFVLLQDAQRDDPNSFLPMRTLYELLASLDCLHLMVVLDCCFAGMFRWASRRDVEPAPPVYRERYQHFVTSPAWQVLVSAASDQRAFDVLSDRRESAGEGHSPFAAALLDGLAGAADLDSNGLVTATELYWYVRRQVERREVAASLLQTPVLFPLDKHQHGEFVFQVKPALELPPAPELSPDTNPYLALASFDEHDAALFFGREAAIDGLVAKATAQQLTVVVGPSGAGKSSLVKAGLLPRLRKLHAPGDRWRIIETRSPGSTSSAALRPGSSPLVALCLLAEGMLGEQVAEAEQATASAPATRSTRTPLEAWRSAIDGLANRPGSTAPEQILIVIDQLEELVLPGRDAEETRAFLDALGDGLRRVPSLHVVVTVRSDIEPLFQDGPLAAWWITGRSPVLPMDRGELREAIVGPARERVIGFQPDSLVDRLIDDVIPLPAPLPLLSFALSELYRAFWRRRVVDPSARDRIVREVDLRAIGSVASSLTRRATEVFSQLAPRTGIIARQVMLRMVTTLGGRVVRRRVLVDELMYPHDEHNARRGEVIRILADARLITVGRELDERGRFVDFAEPAHDELVRGWSQLATWLEQTAEERGLMRAIGSAAETWRSDGELAGASLWNRDRRLERAIALARRPVLLNVDEIRFVRASQNRRRRNRRNLRAIATTIMIGVAGISAVALMQRCEVQNQRQVAEQQLEASLVAQAAEQFQTMQVALRRGNRDGAITAAIQAVALAPDRDLLRPSYLQHAMAMIADSPTSYGRLVIGAERRTPELKFVRFHPNSTLVTGYEANGPLLMWIGGPAWKEVELQQQAGLHVMDAHLDRDIVRWSPDGGYVSATMAEAVDGKDRAKAVMVWDTEGHLRANIQIERDVSIDDEASSLLGDVLSHLLKNVRDSSIDGMRVDICDDGTCAVRVVRFWKDDSFLEELSVIELPSGRVRWQPQRLDDGEQVVVRAKEDAPVAVVYGPAGIRVINLSNGKSRVVWALPAFAFAFSQDDIHAYTVVALDEKGRKTRSEKERPGVAPHDRNPARSSGSTEALDQNVSVDDATVVDGRPVALVWWKLADGIFERRARLPRPVAGDTWLDPIGLKTIWARPGVELAVVSGPSGLTTIYEVSRAGLSEQARLDDRVDVVRAGGSMLAVSEWRPKLRVLDPSHQPWRPISDVTITQHHVGGTLAAGLGVLSVNTNGYVDLVAKRRDYVERVSVTGMPLVQATIFDNERTLVVGSARRGHHHAMLFRGAQPSSQEIVLANWPRSDHDVVVDPIHALWWHLAEPVLLPPVTAMASGFEPEPRPSFELPRKLLVQRTADGTVVSTHARVTDELWLSTRFSGWQIAQIAA